MPSSDLTEGETVVSPDGVSWRVIKARVWDESEQCYVAVLRGDWDHKLIIHRIEED